MPGTHCEGHEHLSEAIAKHEGTATTVKWFAGSAVVITATLVTIVSTIMIWQADKITGRLDKISDAVIHIATDQKLASANVQEVITDVNELKTRLASCELELQKKRK